MANDAAWEAGVRIGSERAREHRARKQALSDAQFQEKHNEIQGMIENLQTKLSYVPESDRNTPDYLKLKDQYAQAIQDRDEHWKSLDHPSEILKFGKMLGRDLHFSKKESPIAPPVYGQPTMEVNGEKVPTEPAYKIQGPQTPAQLKAQKEANQLEAAAPLSPEQVATQNAEAATAGSLASVRSGQKAFIELNPSSTPEEQQANLSQLIQKNFGSTGRGSWTQVSGKINGQPVTLSFDKMSNRYTYPTGEAVPPEDLAPGHWVPDAKNTKPMKYAKGDLVRVKPGQSPTGWVRLLYDPSDPSKRKFIPATPSRFYMGTESSEVTTDPFEVTSTTSRTTKPMSQAVVDLTGMTMVSPEEYTPDKSEGESFTPAAQQPSAPPTPSTPQHSREAVNPPAKSPVASHNEKTDKAPIASASSESEDPLAALPEEKQLDKTMHIPYYAKMNPMIKAAANQLLDGMDIEKLPMPTKDKEAVAIVASQYGWRQGLFTPKEKLLLREAKKYLNASLKDPALKVLDNSNSRLKIENIIKASKPDSSFLRDIIANKWGLSKDEQKFLRLYNQLSGTISGLGQLTRGGRTTEAAVNRVLAELPNAIQSQNAEDAKYRINRLLDEINVAVTDVSGIDVGIGKTESTKKQGSSAPSSPSSTSGDVDVNSLRQKMLEHVRGK